MLEQRATVYLTANAYAHAHAQRINVVNVNTHRIKKTQKQNKKGPAMACETWRFTPAVDNKQGEREQLWQQRMIAPDCAHC